MASGWSGVFNFWRKSMPTVVNAASPAADQSSGIGAGESAAKPTPVAAAARDENDCPVERDVLGRHTWTLLHTMAANVPEKLKWREARELRQYVGTLAKHYPCSPCAKGFQRYVKEHPPKVQSREEFSQWVCELHNAVNERIGKPIFDCSKVDERWRDGWKDGRCD